MFIIKKLPPPTQKNASLILQIQLKKFQQLSSKKFTTCRTIKIKREKFQFEAHL